MESFLGFVGAAEANQIIIVPLSPLAQLLFLPEVHVHPDSHDVLVRFSCCDGRGVLRSELFSAPPLVDSVTIGSRRNPL